MIKRKLVDDQAEIKIPRNQSSFLRIISPHGSLAVNLKSLNTQATFRESSLR